MQLNHLFLFVVVIFFAAVVLRIGCVPINSAPIHIEPTHREEAIDYSYYIMFNERGLSIKKTSIDGIQYLIVTHFGQGTAIIKHEPKEDIEDVKQQD